MPLKIKINTHDGFKNNNNNFGTHYLLKSLFTLSLSLGSSAQISS